MRIRIPVLAILVVVCTGLVVPAVGQETPPTIVAAYESLADTILAVRAAEKDFVVALLDGHRHAAEVLAGQGEWQGVAAQIALFANEGDNAVGGVRKRLLEGGHHFNAAGEEQGLFEPGYVVVTKAAKKELLALSATLRQATDDAARQEAWDRFVEIADELLNTE